VIPFHLPRVGHDLMLQDNRNPVKSKRQKIIIFF
jgi:hypothetical protein